MKKRVDRRRDSGARREGRASEGYGRKRRRRNRGTGAEPSRAEQSTTEGSGMKARYHQGTLCFLRSTSFIDNGYHNCRGAPRRSRTHIPAGSRTHTRAHTQRTGGWPAGLEDEKEKKSGCEKRTGTSRESIHTGSTFDPPVIKPTRQRVCTANRSRCVCARRLLLLLRQLESCE